jgi:hypothetical protein
MLGAVQVGPAILSVSSTLALRDASKPHFTCLTAHTPPFSLRLILQYPGVLLSCWFDIGNTVCMQVETGTPLLTNSPCIHEHWHTIFHSSCWTCSAGYYGNTTGLTTSTCSGPCE